MLQHCLLPTGSLLNDDSRFFLVIITMTMSDPGQVECHQLRDCYQYSGQESPVVC